MQQYKGMLLVISGPSGAGKGTLAARLLREDRSFCFSVSDTTRGPREGEVPGVHYNFITEAEFLRRRDENAYLESACVHGHHYGTPRQPVLSRIEEGGNVLLDIDPQGARSVMAAMDECVSVFILPPSYAELARRLHTRNTDAQAEITRRLHNAAGEIAQVGRYRYALINDKLDEAYDVLRSIVAAEKHRTIRYTPYIAND